MSEPLKGSRFGIEEMPWFYQQAQAETKYASASLAGIPWRRSWEFGSPPRLIIVSSGHDVECRCAWCINVL